MEIFPSIHRIQQSFVNLYLIAEPDGLMLIDTGVDGAASLVLPLIASLDRAPADLKTIVITHADVDHFGGLYGLQQLTDAVACAHSTEANAIRLGQSSRPLKQKGLMKIVSALVTHMMKTRPARIDRTLSGGEELPVLGGLKVLSTPGHTPGHISLFAPSKGVLFAGDSIQVRNGKPAPSPLGNTWDVEKAEESFRAQMALDPQLVLAGHGVWKKPA